MNEREIFDTVLAMADAAEQAAFLARACGDDIQQRQRLEELLDAQRRLGSFLESPPLGLGGESTNICPINEKAGTQIGPYKLLQEIGEGGMGTVFMAEQLEPVRRKVALKVIKPGMDTRQVIARFEAERQALSLMDHPNIAKVLDAGTSDSGRPYFAMELVKGQPITQYCDEHHLTPRQRLELLLPICQAIQHAHQKGIIHRDIKPTNILVAEYDQKAVPKVIDFGVAKATSQALTEKTMFTGFGQIVGTLEYMSPEQAKVNQLDIDTRSDIYSLGVLLYELLTGSTPFDKQRLRTAAWDEMLRIIREEEPPKPSTRLSDLSTPSAPREESGTRSVLPTLASIAAQRHTEPAKLTKLVRGELDWIVMKALEKDRSHRYETVNGLAMDIQRYLADEPIVACPPSTAYRFRKFARRNKTLLATTGVVALSLIAGITGTTWQAIQATHERDRAVAAEGLAQVRLEKEQEERLRAENAESQAKVEAKRADDEAAKSRTEAAIAEAVNRFLTNDLLAQASPSNEPDRDIKLRTVLDRAAEKIDGQFTGQPLVEAAIRKTIGNTYRELGLFEAAQTHFERALKLRQEHLGDEHADTLELMNRLAWSRRHQGHFFEAADLFLRTLESQRRVLGEEHPDTLDTMNALGWTYRRLKKFVDAERLLLKTLEIRQHLWGENHLSVAESMNALGLLYSEVREFGKADSLLLKAIAIRQRLLGDDHPHTMESLEKLATSYWHQGKYAEAEPVALKTLALRRRVLGEDHTDTLLSVGILAHTYGAQRRYAEADKLLHEAIAACEKRAAEYPGELRHRKQAAEILSCLGAVLRRDATRLDESKKAYHQSIAILEELVSLSPSDEEIREGLMNACRSLAAQLDVKTNTKDREKLWRRAATNLEEWFNFDATSRSSRRRFYLADTYRSLADELARQKRNVEAETIYRQAQDQLALVAAETLIDQVHDLEWRRQVVDLSFHRMINLLTAAGRTQEAEQVCQKAINLYERLAAERPDEPFFHEELTKRQAELAKLKEKK